MKINIICNKIDKKNIPNKKFFIKLISYVLIKNKILYFLNIKIVNEYEIKKLNFKFKKINKVTNTLTFYKKINKKNKNIIIGDIAICKTLIEKESKIYNINLYFHWAHIIVHNCLHLIGFNHINKKDSILMEKKEEEVLKKFNIPNPHIIY